MTFDTKKRKYVLTKNEKRNPALVAAVKRDNKRLKASEPKRENKVAEFFFNLSAGIGRMILGIAAFVTKAAGMILGILFPAGIYGAIRVITSDLPFPQNLETMEFLLAVAFLILPLLLLFISGLLSGFGFSILKIQIRRKMEKENERKRQQYENQYDYDDDYYYYECF